MEKLTDAIGIVLLKAKNSVAKRYLGGGNLPYPKSQ